MSEASQGNKLFGDISGIVIKIVIGLVSFQLLAPYVWNYLADLVHIQKIWTFRILTFFYFLLPLILIIFWWRDSKNNFFLLTNPRKIDDNPPDLKAKLGRFIPRFISATQIILIASLVVNFILFFFPLPFINECIIIYIVYSLFLILMIFIIIHAYLITWINFECFDDFTIELKQKARRYKYFWITFGIVFSAFVVLGFSYLINTDDLKENRECVCKEFNIKIIRRL